MVVMCFALPVQFIEVYVLLLNLPFPSSNCLNHAHSILYFCQHSSWDKLVDSVYDKCLLFHRSEIDHLTELMHSRTVNSPIGEEGKRTAVVPSDSVLPRDQKEEYHRTPTLENGIEDHLVSTPRGTSSVCHFTSYVLLRYTYVYYLW